MTEELERKAYRDLIRYVKWLAKTYGIRGHWLLNYDDVMGEALYVLAKCIKAYLRSKPYDEFMALARVSMLNATKTLIYKATLTHRHAELSMLSLDAEDGDDEYHNGGDPFKGPGERRPLDERVPGGIEPEAFYDSIERVEGLVAQLGSDATAVLNAALGGEPRVAAWIGMQRDRRNFVFKDPTITISPYVISRSLLMPEDEVKAAFAEIRSTLYAD